MRIAIQGEQGSFHHMAARHWFGEDVQIVSCRSFADVFDAMQRDAADQAVVAIENSLYGSINEVYDLISARSLHIIGEISERIHQQLITLPNVELQDIQTVVSHPVALEQCTEFLSRKLPQAERVEYHDTAAAVTYIKKLGDDSVAAIAGRWAAELENLPVLQGNIENDHMNYTRFVVLAKDAQPTPDANKSSLVLQTSHEAGALYKALGIFAEAGINLTKLQSRPIIGKVWQYQFYIDVESAGLPLHELVGTLEANGCGVLVLGEYKAAQTEFED